MPERKTNAIIRLTPEAKTRLAALEVDIQEAEKAVAVLKGLGVDVAPIEERLVWAKDVRKTLLTEFAD